MQSELKPKKETVCVGLSGGVDSSVSAQRLIDQGYNVIGVFIKTWHPDFLICDWEAERLDAMRVAAKLGIPFYTCDATDAYKNEVADYMIEEYKNGRTPNPDVMCNRFVKFGAFLKFARELGADKVATGHYAQVHNVEGIFRLERGTDSAKDQSYFLWTLTQEQLAQIYLPVGDTTKQDIRTEAKSGELPTFAKHDSQGICFLGQIDIKEFLSHYITVATGDVLNVNGEIVGTHDGALFYTIGQRHGFLLKAVGTESAPQYVVAKDIEKNTITVSPHQKVLGKAVIILSQVNLIEGTLPATCEAQFRYRQKPFTVNCSQDREGRVMLHVLEESTESPSCGQSCVLYNGKICLGGGIINDIV